MPTIGLCMIVRNEAAIITRCIESTRRLVDYVLTVDTGSTDGTQEVIRAFLRDTNLPGVVVEEPWQNFAFNRTSALAKLREYQEIDYALIMDADDRIIYNSDFDPRAFKAALRQDLYDVTICNDQTRFPRPQLCRNHLNFRYRGVLHEFMEGPAEPYSRGTAVGFYINEVRAGARSQDPEKYHKDAVVLERALETEQDPFLVSRYTFYLAQSYRDAGERKKALANYLKRASLGGWDQEVFISLWSAAQLKEALGHPNGEVIESYLKAHAACPSRAESLYDAMRYCRACSKFQQGYLIGKRAVTIPNPGAGLFVQPWIYAYGLFDEFSANAYLSGNYRDSLHYCQIMLSGNSLPPDQRERVQMNANLAHAMLVGLSSHLAAADTIPSTKGKSGTRAKSGRKVNRR